MPDITEFPAYGVTEFTTTMSELSLKTDPLAPNDIAIDVTHCGICHSDVHHLEGDWAVHGIKAAMPLCPGHEVVGHVVAIGSDVTSHKIGDRVGCGPQRDSACYRDNISPKCENCENGEEQLCENGIISLYNPKSGGFGSYLEVPQHFAFKIPAEISSAHAGPLLCAGVTVFSPLVAAGLPKGAKVAVVGVGGLGHLGIQYAAKMGFEVTAITTSMDKAPLIKSLGAVNIIDSTDPAQMAKHKLYFHYILNTVSAPISTDAYLAMLKKKGTLCYVGLGNEPVSMSPFAIAGGGNKRVVGSFIGGSVDMVNMLKFSAENDVMPMIEVVDVPFGSGNAGKVTAAVEKVVKNKARFRMVLDYKKE